MSIGLWVLGQFQRIELDHGRAIYGHDLVLLFVCFGSFILWKKQMIQSLRTRLGIFFFSFFCWITFNILWSFSSDPRGMFTAFLYLFRLIVIVGYGWTLSQMLLKRWISQTYFAHIITMALALVSVLGFLQYLLFPDTRSLVYLGWDDHYFRLISTLFDPGFTGIILAVAAAIHLRTAVIRKLQWKEGVLIGMHLIGLLLTYSRASYVAFACGVLFLAVLYRKWKVLILLPILGLSLVILPRPGGEGVKLERTASVIARLESNTSALASPSYSTLLVGNGWYAKKTEQPTQIKDGVVVSNHSSAPENSFVFVLSALGIVGLVLFIALLGALVLFVGIKSEFALALALVSIHALFSNTLFHPFILILLCWIMVRSGRGAPQESQ